MFITRRQFLKYCAASAAALGLTQTDLLKLEKAMAEVTSCDPGTIPGGLGPCPRVVWIAGANCSGCATGLLNFVAPQSGYSPLGMALTPETWTENVPALAAAYPLLGALDFDGDGVIDIGDVAVNVISIDYAYIVAGAAGDVLNEHMLSIVQSTQPYVLLMEGAVQIKGEGLFCRIFEVPEGRTITIPARCAYYNGTKPGFAAGKTLVAGDDVTFADGSAYLASRPNCAAVLAMGTCATWGGIPAAKGNKTGAISAWEWLAKKNGLTTPICNIPGCPPHPDWVVAPILHLILHGLADLAANLDTSLCTTKINDPGVAGLMNEARPKLTYLPMFPASKVFCDPNEGHCPRLQADPTQDPLETKLVNCGRSTAHPNGRCLRLVGCNGWKGGAIGVKADCPTRMFNTHTNWCVGNNYPCQGCTDPNFPDGCSPFFEAAKGKWAGII